MLCNIMSIAISRDSVSDNKFWPANQFTVEVLPRLELGSLDSKSKVLTEVLVAQDSAKTIHFVS